MSTSRLLPAAAALMVAACGVVVTGAAAQGIDDRPRSMTDTVEYCDHLARRFAAAAPNRPPHLHAATMAADGNKLCQQGHMRPGILRLRRALLMLDQAQGP
jgi:hypothetical protein